MKTLPLLAISLLTAATFVINPGAYAATLRITEVMSASGSGGTSDWFEVTNFDLTDSVDITGWRMDDSSFSFSSAAALNGITSIGAGQTVVFLESADPGSAIPAFRAFWGTNADTFSIGSYSGTGVSFGAGGDGAVLFDTNGTEQTPRVNFGVATTGSTFFYGYNRSGGFDTYGSSSNGVISTVGTIVGSDTNQVTYTSANTLGNIGSPGTAINAIPEPSTHALLVMAGAGLVAYHLRRRPTAIVSAVPPPSQ